MSDGDEDCVGSAACDTAAPGTGDTGPDGDTGVDTATPETGTTDTGLVDPFGGVPCEPWSLGATSTRWCGSQALEHFGEAAVGGSDITGDGRPDVVVSAPAWADGQGGGTIFILANPLSPGTTGGTVSIAHEDDGSFWHLGYDLASIADFEGDGYVDLVVSSSQSGYRRVQLFSGPLTRDMTDHDAAVDLELGHLFSNRAPVALVPDVNGDRTAELLVVGAEVAEYQVDQAYLLRGPLVSGMVEDVAATTYALAGEEPEASNLASGDLDGDGVSEVLFQLPDADQTLYLVSADLTGVVNPADHVVLRGGAASRFGDSYGLGTGDYDGDGYGDIVVDCGGETWHGCVLPGPFTTSDPEASSRAIVRLTADTRYGGSAAFVGDVDGDGFSPDIALQGCGARCIENGDAGWEVFLFGHGLEGEQDERAALTRISSPAGHGLWAMSFSDAGDLDGDGDDEVLASSPSDAENAWAAGSLWIFHGGSW